MRRLARLVNEPRISDRPPSVTRFSSIVFRGYSRKCNPDPVVPARVLAYYSFENTGVFYVEFITSDKNFVGNFVVDMPFNLKDEKKPTFIIDKMSVVNGPDYRQLNDWYQSKKNKTPYVCK
jgi:hypothetical protein